MATKTTPRRGKATRGKGSRDRGYEGSIGQFADNLDRLRDKAVALLDRLPLATLATLVTALEKHALPEDPDEARKELKGRALEWDAVRDTLSVLDAVVRSEHALESLDAVDVACFIHNNGTADDRTESLLALMPVARAVKQRLAENNDAGDETNQAEA